MGSNPYATRHIYNPNALDLQFGPEQLVSILPATRVGDDDDDDGGAGAGDDDDDDDDGEERWRLVAPLAAETRGALLHR